MLDLGLVDLLVFLRVDNCVDWCCVSSASKVLVSVHSLSGALLESSALLRKGTQSPHGGDGRMTSTQDNRSLYDCRIPIEDGA